jgi:hypothetical protein
MKIMNLSPIHIADISPTIQHHIAYKFPNTFPPTLRTTAISRKGRGINKRVTLKSKIRYLIRFL